MANVAKTYPVAITAESEIEAARKRAALEKLALNLTADNLILIGNASAKPNANAKIKQYAAFL